MAERSVMQSPEKWRSRESAGIDAKLVENRKCSVHPGRGGAVVHPE
jgi:hypothetical protein